MNHAHPHANKEWWFTATTTGAAWLVVFLLCGVIASLIVGAWPVLGTERLSFFTRSTWDPVQNNFGALAPVAGTLITATIALLIAVPVAFGIAVFLTELCPAKLRTPIGILVELLASIPSIIYGLWGLFVFAPFYAENVQKHLTEWTSGVPFLEPLFAGPPMGIGISTAGIILAFMIIPFIAAVMRDVFEVVPGVLKESAYALGATRWEVVRSVVLPYAKVGVFGGVMLGLGRALGETMAVTFVIGNAYNLSASVFEPGNSIASALANEFAEATAGKHASALIALGLTLFLMTLVVLILAQALLRRMERATGGR